MLLIHYQSTYALGLIFVREYSFAFLEGFYDHKFIMFTR